mmetsp:Transcript_51133/g.108645  ORF Transcript_51133/g.108645 Transcript_51133/m.108645 type:complete len:401 (-) Transcript_51133:228-1430(-)
MHGLRNSATLVQGKDPNLDVDRQREDSDGDDYGSADELNHAEHATFSEEAGSSESHGHAHRLPHEAMRKHAHPLPSICPLPGSIYGALMMAILRSTTTSGKPVFKLLAAVCSGAMLTICMQIYVLWCTKKYVTDPSVVAVQKLYRDFEEEAYRNDVIIEGWEESFAGAGDLCQMPLAHPPFFFAILSIWTGTCFILIVHTWRNLQVMVKLPNPAQGQWYTSWSFAEAPTAKESMFDFREVIVTHVASIAKMFIGIAVYLPKIIVICVVWWLGARWLTSSLKLQDLVLNAVALVFIMDLDTLIYHCCVPVDVQAMVDMYRLARKRPKNEHHTEEDTLRLLDKKTMRRIARMVLAMTFVMAWTLVYMVFLQRVLPGYKWDLLDICESYWRNSMHLHGSVPIF